MFEKDVLSSEEKKLIEEFHQREQEQIVYEETHERILKQNIGVKESKQAKKEAEKIERFYIYDSWKRLFNRCSFFNEIACQCMFHSLLGQLLRDKKIKRSGGRYLDYRIHFFWIQDSRTGKGEAMSFVRYIGEQLTKKDGEMMRFYKVGRRTDASFINSCVYDQRTRTYLPQMRQGVLELNDIVYWEEASKLLRPSTYGEELKDIMMTVMEPLGSSKNEYPKSLDMWPMTTYTRSPSTIIATTRPVSNIRPDLVYDGMMQRMLLYVRNVNDNVRRRMNEKVAITSFESDDLQKDVRKLVEDFNDLREFAFNNIITLQPERKDKIIAFMKEKIMYFDEDIKDSIMMMENKEILRSFVGGFNDNMIKLIHHSAVMRKSKYVDMEDVEYAFNLLNGLYVGIKYWVELDVGVEMNRRDLQRISILKGILMRNKRQMSRTKLVGIASKSLSLSENAVYQLIKRYSNGKHAIFKITPYEKDKGVLIEI